MNIKEKIKKLLALATSPNENEARSALLKAKELMAKHKLEEADINPEKTELRSITCSDVKWTTDSGHTWMVELCQLISNNYCCTTAWSTPRGSRTHTLVLTGVGDDVEVCKTAIEYAVQFVLHQMQVMARKLRTKDARSYAQGFIVGLDLAFENQRDDHPEWGLVVVKSEEVEEYERSLGTKSVAAKRTHYDPLAYLKGQNDGEHYLDHVALEG